LPFCRSLETLHNWETGKTTPAVKYWPSWNFLVTAHTSKLERSAIDCGYTECIKVLRIESLPRSSESILDR